MQQRRMTVMLASERGHARDMLAEVMKDKGWLLVGQAENGAKAISMARQLRPDAVVVDTHLPHVIGEDGNRLSRIGGLDAAQTISENLPAAQVVLLDDWGTLEPIDANGSYDRRLSPSEAASLFRTYEGAKPNPLNWSGLMSREMAPHPIIFAKVDPLADAFQQQTGTVESDLALIIGGLLVIGGLALALTLILAVPGLFLAAVGALILGIRQVTRSLFGRLRRSKVSSSRAG